MSKIVTAHGGRAFGHGLGVCIADARRVVYADRRDRGEFIGSERGVGKIIVEAEARANSADMRVAILVLMAVGCMLAVLVRRLQERLRRWQPQFAAKS
jgi:hypothetical protein